METQEYETVRGRQMPPMGKSQHFLSDEHAPQMSIKRQTSSSVFCHQEGNTRRLHISYAFHLQSLNLYSLNSLGECCIFQTAFGHRQMGIFHSHPDELQIVAGLHPVLFLPHFHITYT